MAAKPEPVARPTLQEIEAAARVLYEEGRFHHWWSRSLPEVYQQMGPIERDELEAIAERILMASAAARQARD